MKLGIIHTRGRFFMSRYLEMYSGAGIEYDFSGNLEEFLDEHQPMRFAYDGFLIHPLLDGFNVWMTTFKENIPLDSRYALLTHNIGSSLVVEKSRNELSVFDVADVEGIKKYFGEK